MQDSLPRPRRKGKAEVVGGGKRGRMQEAPVRAATAAEACGRLTPFGGGGGWVLPCAPAGERPPCTCADLSSTVGARISAPLSSVGAGASPATRAWGSSWPTRPVGIRPSWCALGQIHPLECLGGRLPPDPGCSDRKPRSAFFCARGSATGCPSGWGCSPPFRAATAIATMGL